MDVGAAASVAVVGGVVDVLRKALQALTNILGTKYGIALALRDRQTGEVFHCTTGDITKEMASEMFQMPGTESTEFVDRQM